MKMGFADLKITRQFVDALEQVGFVDPTEIQQKSIPPALAGQDILGIARTGSGKTLAYLLPVVMKIKQADSGFPKALIMAPSKELVIQIKSVLDLLTQNTDIRSVVLYGGIGKKQQVGLIEQGCEIIVSTPGRFLDLYSYGHILLKEVKTLVLDEADRLMEMGFMDQLRAILEVIPTKRQNLLFSATFPERMERLAAEFLEFPTRIEGTQKEKPVDEVEQFWTPAPNFRTKLNVVLSFLKDTSWERVMIFCRTKDSAERTFRYLERKDIGEVRVLHANKGQNTRIKALDDFREGSVRVLVTTDVTSRGIDVENVSHVINFEVPKSPQDYLHRIGRTARIHREGMAVTLANKAEEFDVVRINEFLGGTLEKKPLSDQVETAPDLPGEKQEILKEIDHQKRKSDPTFKGAFHDRKRNKKKRTR